MEDIKITNKNRPSNDVVFGLVFEDMQLFAVMAKWIVEVNLKYYKATEDKELNVLCEFLKIQTTKELCDFREEYKESAYGVMLYDRYIEVISDKDTMEEVEKMDLYQEKIQLHYHSVDEANALMKKAEKKAEKAAHAKKLKAAENLLRRGILIEYIAEDMEFTPKDIEILKNRTKVK
jgi:hypothetical protein